MEVIYRMKILVGRFPHNFYVTQKARILFKTRTKKLLYFNSVKHCSTLSASSPAAIKVLLKVPLNFHDKYIGSCNCSLTQRHFSTAKTEVVSPRIDQNISKLLDKATKIDIMITSIKKEKLMTEVKQLISQGYPDNELDVLAKNTKVFYNIPQFTELVKTLLDLGYMHTDIPVLLTNEPSVTEMTSDEFMTYFKNLNSLGLITRKIVKITSKCPQILNIDAKKMQERFSELRELFKTKDVFILIEKSPHVLFDNMNSISERFAYVTQEMGITQRQIMYSQLFNLPLEHLHARHMFLVRTGFFKKAVNDKQVSKNPTLDEIIDTPDKVFLERFGGLSVKEYEVFKTLLKRDRIITKDRDSSRDIDRDIEG